MTRTDASEAIQAVRLAAHELANACRSLVGGTEMAISIASVERLADDPKEIDPEETKQ